jgi:hypothetical protein
VDVRRDEKQLLWILIAISILAIAAMFVLKSCSVARGGSKIGTRSTKLQANLFVCHDSVA